MKLSLYKLFMYEQALVWFSLGIAALLFPHVIFSMIGWTASNGVAKGLCVIVGSTSLAMCSFFVAGASGPSTSDGRQPFLYAAIATNIVIIYGLWAAKACDHFSGSGHFLVFIAHSLAGAIGAVDLAARSTDEKAESSPFEHKLLKRILTIAALGFFLIVPHALLLNHFTSSKQPITWPLPENLGAALGALSTFIICSHIAASLRRSNAQNESDAVFFARHIRSFILPYVVVVLIPTALITMFEIVPPLTMSAFPTLVLAGVLWCTGLLLMCVTIDAFEHQGRGTLAPFDPTQVFVCSGPYAHSRNPMITGVLLLLAALACAYRAWPLAAWTATFAAAKTAYFIFDEEPTLELRFGDSYRRYKAAVPRWIPNLRAFRPPPAAAEAVAAAGSNAKPGAVKSD